MPRILMCKRWGGSTRVAVKSPLLALRMEGRGAQACRQPLEAGKAENRFFWELPEGTSPADTSLLAH